MTTVEDVEIGDDAQALVGTTVNGNVVQTQISYVQSRSSLLLSDEHVRDRVRGYVRAVNHDEIVGSLGRSGVIGLAGHTGDGVERTAVAALRQVRPDLPIRLFSVDRESIDDLRLSTGVGCLVRARDEEEAVLRSCVAAARSRGA